MNIKYLFKISHMVKFSLKGYVCLTPACKSMCIYREEDIGHPALIIFYIIFVTQIYLTEPQSFCLCQHSPEVTVAQPCLGFYVSAGNLNTGPDTCIATTLSCSAVS